MKKATSGTTPLDTLLKRTFVDFQQSLEFARAPLIIERAEGVYYWDTQGKRYFDAIGGIFVAVLGHGHPRVIDAMRRQMERLTFAPPLHGVSDVTLEFIDKLGSVTPGTLKFVKPFSGGSESVEAAIKYTRQYWKQSGFPGKYKFVSRYHGYHGATAGAMSASGTGKRKAKFEPQMAGFLKVFPPTHYRDRFASWGEANAFAARSVEDVIVHEDPDTVAGVIVEPIGNTGGIITPDENYFRILRDVSTKHNVLLIFDEVITGFGRTGNFFAAQTFGTTPDMICSGKAATSGAIPLGAMIAKEELNQAFLGAAEDEVQFAHGHTFAGHALACAAGIAVIDEIVDKGLAERARTLGAYLEKKLRHLDKHGVVREVRGRGMLLGVELTDHNVGKALKPIALKNGLILRVDPGWFAVAPAINATEAELDEMCELIDRSLGEAVAAAGG
jgi:adenosylmethionine-8-amino-7-oxononanoate aminotransferase